MSNWNRKSDRFPWLTLALTTLVFCCLQTNIYADATDDMQFIDNQIKLHAGKTGALLLDTGQDALVARAWLADHATASITVQYFIWSTDNVGILASEAILRAAERGVEVRVVVDDLLVDAADETLLALAKHPNVSIKIYNPKHSVGIPFYRRALNLLTDFRGANQRMHDKTFIVDAKIAITGGRNMADEYFDYDHEYNFRDRDVLVLGQVVKRMHWSFEQFWNSELSVDLENQKGKWGLLEKDLSIDPEKQQQLYSQLHAYAQNPENFNPELRTLIDSVSTVFPQLLKQVVWDEAQFVSDQPGKNEEKSDLGGGGLSSSELAKLLAGAKREVIIQSPYLILSEEAEEVFRQVLAKGIKIKVSTNSLASTDNLQAFSGYRNQRSALLDMGMQIFEFKPNPSIRLQLHKRYGGDASRQPVFALHAKSMVVDSELVFIGSYNLDPRSENLNTEVGIILRNRDFASRVQTAILQDMDKENSWDAKLDKPDQYAGWWKRTKVGFWQLMPLKPIL